jgi:hypothetical protein
MVAKKIYIRGYGTAKQVHIVAKKLHYCKKKKIIVAENVYMIFKKG